MHGCLFFRLDCFLHLPIRFGLGPHAEAPAGDRSIHTFRRRKMSLLPKFSEWIGERRKGVPRSCARARSAFTGTSAEHRRQDRALRKGQPLFTIYSPDLVATEREYLVAKQNQQRVAQSTIQGVVFSAASLLDATAERLNQWGVPQKEIARLESTSQVQQELEVAAPVSGYITERNALPSVAVQPEMRLYTLADLSTVWVQAQVFQNDLERLKIGAHATLTVNTYPGRTFTGRVDFIDPQVDMDMRTAKARVVFSNPGLQLKPGMFVNVSL